MNDVAMVGIDLAKNVFAVHGVDPTRRWMIRRIITRAAVESHIPMRRAGHPEEIASVFAFLPSDEGSDTTGQTIFACGGLSVFAEFRTNWASGPASP